MTFPYLAPYQPSSPFVPYHFMAQPSTPPSHLSLQRYPAVPCDSNAPGTSPFLTPLERYAAQKPPSDPVPMQSTSSRPPKRRIEENAEEEEDDAEDKDSKKKEYAEDKDSKKKEDAEDKDSKKKEDADDKDDSDEKEAKHDSKRRR